MHETTSTEVVEADRLAALQATRLLDTECEPAYDDITDLAASVCDTPIALISLVDEARQWFKSVVGLPCRTAPRDGSICDYVVRTDSSVEVGDLILDGRFNHFPAVQSAETKIRFYAGHPLHSIDGYAIGSFCVIDFIPRILTTSQKRQLRSLARQVESQIHLRQQVASLENLIEERAALSRELENSERRFRAFMEHSPAPAFIKDATGRMLYYNRAAAELHGVSEHAWLGKTDHELWPAGVADALQKADAAVLNQDCEIAFEERTTQADGSDTYWKSYKFPYVDGDGNRLLAGVSVNISGEKKLQEELRAKEIQLVAANTELQKLALTDALTGLGNRRLFDLVLDRDFKHSQRTGRPISVLMLDLDHFKTINDTHGHACGDEVLREFGRLLKSTVRANDHVCRCGGEEFSVMLLDTDGAQAHALAERIRAAVRCHDWRLTPLTVSIGVSVSSACLADGVALAAEADRALYAAKRAGRNRVCLLPCLPKSEAAHQANN